MVNEVVNIWKDGYFYILRSLSEAPRLHHLWHSAQELK
jgi:hypothetical protein